MFPTGHVLPQSSEDKTERLVQTTSRKKERKNPRYFTEVRMRTAISHDPSGK